VTIKPPPRKWLTKRRNSGLRLLEVLYREVLYREVFHRASPARPSPTPLLLA
jgi:hypothetical protein